jgi:DNA repair protein RadC
MPRPRSALPQGTAEPEARGEAGNQQIAGPRGRAAASRQVSFVPPDGAALLHLMRENLRLMAQLAARYEVQGLEPVLGGPAAVAIGGPADVAAYLGPELRALGQEQLRAVLLDSRLRLVGTPLIYQGGLNATAGRLADCFRDAVRLGAAFLILVHNHPSGDPTPSPRDVRLTAEAGRAGALLGIEVLDHVVVGRPGHVSLRERGLYRPEAGAGERPDNGGDPDVATPTWPTWPGDTPKEGTPCPKP